MPGQESPVDVAKHWLSLVDSGDYRRSWMESASAMRNVVPSDQWATQIATVRGQLGSVTSRTVAVEQRFTELPNAPPGEYDVIQFHSVFGGTSAVTETVTPMRDIDGQWRVSGYFIR
ncbi:MAG: DUF4019 domain-containing protein [Gemmatimonadota bacterium]|nr:DUF4019 domain-containing protein [Gemmatimonadota bacterium]